MVLQDAAWLPVPDKHPTFDPVDLLLEDGSVLCGCLPQSDGDYWWNGLGGEVFIDPKYAPVTHWRLSAAPSINEGVRKVTRGFRWESEAQHHIPTIVIEFEPVSSEAPNDAKGWQDRDRLAAMLTPEAKP